MLRSSSTMRIRRSSTLSLVSGMSSRPFAKACRAHAGWAGAPCESETRSSHVSLSGRLRQKCHGRSDLQRMGMRRSRCCARLERATSEPGIRVAANVPNDVRRRAGRTIVRGRRVATGPPGAGGAGTDDWRRVRVWAFAPFRASAPVSASRYPSKRSVRASGRAFARAYAADSPPANGVAGPRAWRGLRGGWSLLFSSGANRARRGRPSHCP